MVHTGFLVCYPSANVAEGYKSITGLVAPLATMEPADPLAPDNQPDVRLRFCGICNSLIVGKPQVIEQKETCSKCAEEALKKNPAERRRAFGTGLLFGSAAAVIGMAFCTLFGLLTKLDVNYLALFVGWLVAAGMMQGSNGIRGPRYQFASVFLTYFAVSLSSIPIYLIPIVFWLPPDFRLSSIMGKLAYWAVASPVLELKHGIWGFVGLSVLFLGMRLATRITAAEWQDSAIKPVEKKDELGIGI
jgi:hypothetical protein